MRNAPLALALLTACSSAPLEGHWLGACETADFGVRTELFVVPDDDETLENDNGSAWLLDHPYDLLGFYFQQTSRDYPQITLGEAQAAWRSECCDFAPYDIGFELSLTEDDPADSLSGTCTWQGVQGTASFARLPQ